MRITRVTGRDFMGLRFVDVVLDKESNTTTIGGHNSAGKTSLLKLMRWALGGAKQIGDKPVRAGKSKAEVDMLLEACEGDGIEWQGLKIHRERTEKGTDKFTLTPIDGSALPSPQAVLHKVLGPLAFDPMEFALNAANRVKILQAVTGVDTTQVDKQLAAATERRRDANVTLRNVTERARTARNDVPVGAPTERVDLGSLLAEMRAAEEHNRLTERKQADRDRHMAVIEGLREKMAELQAELDRTDAEVERLTAACAEWEPLEDTEDIEVFQRRLDELEPQNAAYDKRALADRLEKEQVASEAAALQATEAVKALDAQREAMVRDGAKTLGIEGLEWDAAGVTYNGVPFDDCSSTEQVLVSCSVQIASHAALPVMFVHNAAMLEPENQRLLAQKADEAGCHLFMEVPGDSTATLVLEAGEVVQAVTP